MLITLDMAPSDQQKILGDFASDGISLLLKVEVVENGIPYYEVIRRTLGAWIRTCLYGGRRGEPEDSDSDQPPTQGVDNDAKDKKGEEVNNQDTGRQRLANENRHSKWVV